MSGCGVNEVRFRSKRVSRGGKKVGRWLGSSVSVMEHELNALLELLRELAPTYGFPPVNVRSAPDYPHGGMRHLELDTSRIRRYLGLVAVDRPSRGPLRVPFMACDRRFAVLNAMK